MLGWLRRLFGRGGIETEKTEANAASAPSSPVAVAIADDGAGAGAGAAPAPETEDARDSAFFCREALVGRDQKIVGYEFGYPQHLQPRIIEKRARIRRHYDDMLLQHLASLALDSFLGDRLALVEISPASLEHPSLAALLRGKIALLLSFPETGKPDTRMLAQVMAVADRLRADGARLGLKWQSAWPREVEGFPLLPYLDFVQVAWPDGAGADPAAFFSSLRQARAHSAGIDAARPEMPLRLIAGGLRTPDDFRQCYRLGVDFFRGEFINSRDQEKASKSAVNRLRILQLLNKLRQ
ncbi:MAG: hypothetical protein LBI59_01520, partial [Candidatus Accumulibacter sp.]|nr:hypothetical protein [Accumulibacter sp.]